MFLQHPGSDEAVWRGRPPAQILPALREAASSANLVLRAGDVAAVIDRLEMWNASESHSLRRRLDLKSVGMSGHSFNAVTSQAVGGQSVPPGKNLVDRRVSAAVMMSPASPVPGKDPGRFFGEVAIPWLLMTGTNNNSPILDIDNKSRVEVFSLAAGRQV